MKPLTRILLPLLVCLCLAPGARSQEERQAVALEVALDLFHRNSPRLAAARSRLRREVAGSRQGEALPNPVASLSNEDLGAYSERYFNIRQPVDFLWAMGARGDHAEARRLEARARFQADSARLALDVKLGYLEAWRAGEAAQARARVDVVVALLLDVAGARYAEGDISGYEVRRLAVERSGAALRLAAVESELAVAQAVLGSLVSEGRPTALGAKALDSIPPRLPTGFSAEARALERRPELAGARAVVDAWEAEVAMARGSILAGASLTGGIKQQSDGQEGLFLGLELPIPLLDRRSRATDAARAGADGAESAVTAGQQMITRQASLAETRLASVLALGQRLGDAGVADGEELLRIARVAWDEGEIGIVELLDATGTYLESQLMRISQRTDVWRAYFQLEWAVGGLPETVDRGDDV